MTVDLALGSEEDGGVVEDMEGVDVVDEASGDGSMHLEEDGLGASQLMGT